MLDRGLQEIRKDPENGSYPIIKGLFYHRIVQTDPRPIPEYREQDWSHTHKGQMLSVWLIAILFAVLVVGAVFS